MRRRTCGRVSGRTGRSTNSACGRGYRGGARGTGRLLSQRCMSPPSAACAGRSQRGLRRASVRGLAIVPAEECAVPLRRITYQSADGTYTASGIAAIARALEHIHLGWALAGFAMRHATGVELDSAHHRCVRRRSASHRRASRVFKSSTDFTDSTDRVRRRRAPPGAWSTITREMSPRELTRLISRRGHRTSGAKRRRQRCLVRLARRSGVSSV